MASTESAAGDRAPRDGLFPEVRCNADRSGRTIRQIIAHHRKDDRDDGARRSCGCGAEGLPDHSHHLAQEIVDRLGLTQESAGDRSSKIRYFSAWFDDELTKLEGAE